MSLGGELVSFTHVHEVHDVHYVHRESKSQPLPTALNKPSFNCQRARPAKRDGLTAELPKGALILLVTMNRGRAQAENFAFCLQRVTRQAVVPLAGWWDIADPKRGVIGGWSRSRSVQRCAPCRGASG
jgi:hypothetical protein